MSVFASASALIAQQQIAVGMVGAAAIGGVMFGLRAAPGRILAVLREVATVTLVLESGEDAFRYVAVWLSTHQKAKTARRVRLAERFDYDSGAWKWDLTLGAGWHVIVLGGRPVFIHRYMQEADALGKAFGGAPVERFTIISLGRSQAAVRALLAAARTTYFGDGRVQVYAWVGGQFMLADKRPRRGFDTVFLPEYQKALLVDDLKRFMGSRERYARRGTPWRRGYLFEGPPGTGKTTLIHVLGSLAERSIYVINLNNVGGDNELLRATNEVGPDGMLVIEDIDSAKFTHDRDVVEAQQALAPMLTVPAQPTGRQAGVSLSGLLNAIDGVTAREGRILCITSNHAEKLDPALVRPGRVDVRLTINKLERAEAYSMFRAFQPEAGWPEFERMVGGRLPISAAELQNLLLSSDEDPPVIEEAAA